MTEEPPGFRNTDPGTSARAWDFNRRGRTSMRDHILAAHAHALVHDAQYLRRGLTDEEAALAAGIDITGPSCWWKRSSELRESRRKWTEVLFIDGVPVERNGRAGVPREACVITHAGLDRLEEIGYEPVLP